MSRGEDFMKFCTRRVKSCHSYTIHVIVYAQNAQALSSVNKGGGFVIFSPGCEHNAMSGNWETHTQCHTHTHTCMHTTQLNLTLSLSHAHIHTHTHTH